ncbi:MAG TPA: glycosyltransferase family 2 protein [Hyphomicrobiaceae bacterium]|nr:glycosyltransferase family 2 protein [Hyphomicrobiaceae bacterium]
MKILVSVISYNEEASIEGTLKDLIANNCGYDIVVIDNGSNDTTQEICARLSIPVIRHCVNTGGSVGTLLSYFAFAYAMNYDILCQFDSDGQHIAAELPKIIEPIRNGEVDCMIGSRFINNEGFQSTILRRLGIRLFSRLFTSVTGCPLTDITSGFRAYGRGVIEFFGHTYRDPIYDSMNQFLLLTFFAGFSIRETPVLMRSRRAGASEFTLFRSIAFPVKGIVTFIACLLQRRKVAAMRS